MGEKCNTGFSLVGQVSTCNAGSMTIKQTCAAVISYSFPYTTPNTDGAAFGNDGSLYIAAFTQNTIYKVTQPAGVQSTFATGSYLQHIAGLCIDNQQNLWTGSDTYGLVKVTSAAVISNPVGSPISVPRGMACSPLGDVYILSSGTNIVYRYTTYGVLMNVATVAVVQGEILFLRRMNVMIFNLSPLLSCSRVV